MTHVCSQHNTPLLLILAVLLIEYSMNLPEGKEHRELQKDSRSPNRKQRRSCGGHYRHSRQALFGSSLYRADLGHSSSAVVIPEWLVSRRKRDHDMENCGPVVPLEPPKRRQSIPK
ncbi:hypothetical protein M513_06098, partial [Trichuris suis]